MTNASRRLIAWLEIRAARNAESRDVRRTMGEHIAAAVFGAWAEATEACLADVRELLDEIEVEARIGRPEPEDVACTCNAYDHDLPHDPYCPENPLYERAPGVLVGR